MRTIYTHRTNSDIYNIMRSPPDFSDSKAVELDLSPMGFPIVDGQIITNPQEWYNFMTSNKFTVFQGSNQILDASLKPILSIGQVIDLYKIGEVGITEEHKVNRYGAQVKLGQNYDIRDRPHKTWRLVNLKQFCPTPLPPEMLRMYPVLYYEELKKYGLPVTDLVSIASVARNFMIYNCEKAFWDLGKWIEQNPRNENILEVFRKAAPAPLQETAMVGHEGEVVRCLDFVNHHLHIIKHMPYLRPGYCNYIFEPGFDQSKDIHGAHLISVFIIPGKHKFSPIIMRVGDFGAPIPVEGPIEKTWVTQQTIEDLLWAGYSLSDITFHESVRIQNKPRRGPFEIFSKPMDNLLSAVQNINPIYSPKELYQTIGGNFLATTTKWDETGKPVRIALSTYNPIMYSYVRGKSWSLVWRLTELLENPINRNPDEVYTTDKAVPSMIDGYELKIKRTVEDFIQFDPYFKSPIGIGPEIMDIINKYPDSKAVTIIRTMITGLGEVASSGNLMALGRQQERRIDLVPHAGHRNLAEEPPSVGHLEGHLYNAGNINSRTAGKRVSGIVRYEKDTSRLLEE